jgi:hypothetical protein
VSLKFKLADLNIQHDVHITSLDGRGSACPSLIPKRESNTQMPVITERFKKALRCKIVKRESLNLTKSELISMGMADSQLWFAYLDLSLRSSKLELESFNESGVSIRPLVEVTGRTPCLPTLFKKNLIKYFDSRDGNEIIISVPKMIEMGFIRPPTSLSMIQVFASV